MKLIARCWSLSMFGNQRVGKAASQPAEPAGRMLTEPRLRLLNARHFETGSWRGLSHYLPVNI
jgi:hypothetical protein